MYRRHILLMVIGLLALIMVLVSGCTQTDDVLISVGSTELVLKPQRLPSNPEGTIYELWVIDTSKNAISPVSLGKFGYDFEKSQFLDKNGDPRPDGARFLLDGDLFDYDSILISVEKTNDVNESQPDAIMLLDGVSDPGENPMKLVFPLSDSLWKSTARYNMETPSDGRTPASDGAGVWFSNYAENTVDITDTLGLISFNIVLGSIDKDTLITSIIDIASVDTVVIPRVFGLDTVMQTAVVLEFVTVTDSIRPVVTSDVTLNYNVGNTQTLTYDNFTQDDFNLPDYSAYGWHYRGWVVTPHVPTANGTLTKPAWNMSSNLLESVIPGSDGGMISTGTFSEITQADDGNPFTGGTRVPSIPGEDFMTSLPAGVTAPLNLVPGNTDNNGSVFISLEPMSYTGKNTNFPLIAFTRKIPVNRADVTASLQQFSMFNWVQTNDPFRGFPSVIVEINRFEH